MIYVHIFSIITRSSQEINLILEAYMLKCMLFNSIKKIKSKHDFFQTKRHYEYNLNEVKGVGSA